MAKENVNISENFWLYKDEKSTLEKQNIKKNHKDLVGKSLDTKNYAKNGLSKRTT